MTTIAMIIKYANGLKAIAKRAVAESDVQSEQATFLLSLVSSFASIPSWKLTLLKNLARQYIGPDDHQGTWLLVLVLLAVAKEKWNWEESNGPTTTSMSH